MKHLLLYRKPRSEMERIQHQCSEKSSCPELNIWLEGVQNATTEISLNSQTLLLVHS